MPTGPNRIGEPIERKYAIQAVSREHSSSRHDEHHAVLFLAKDRAFPAALRAYHDECQRLGADERQLQSVANLMERVQRYQAAHPELVKVPDVDEGPLGLEVAAPNVAPALYAMRSSTPQSTPASG